MGVVQASIPQDVKIDYDFAEEVNQKHIRMTEELLDSGQADIVFWSESSTMYPFLLGGIGHSKFGIWRVRGRFRFCWNGCLCGQEGL